MNFSNLAIDMKKGVKKKFTSSRSSETITKETIQEGQNQSAWVEVEGRVITTEIH